MWFKKIVERGLRKVEDGEDVTRRVRVEEPSDRFVLIIVLMVVFFVGLIALEIVHMLLLGRWNEVVFNGIMLVVGTIVGAIWGRQNE